MLMTDKSRRILIAEDSDETRIALKLMLKLSGYATLEAADGQEALRLAQSGAPDLVITDISLPGIDGLELTRQLRGDPRLGSVPVIVVSAHDSESVREEVRAAGATDYLSKPLEFDELRELLEKYL